MKLNQITKLSILILIAFIVRVIVIWVERPEFVGWFNHTYYYYVQTRGLLENGSLPFPEMPLLFYIYSFTAKLLNWFGVEINAAIVIATRFWMCLIPSILPIPVYATFRSIYKEQLLPKWIWIFLFVSAFYPFSILNMTEFLQKNVIGLFLLSILIQQSILVLEKQNIKRIGIIIFIFLIIIFTHFGTTAVALLYLASLMLSFLFHNKISTSKLALSLVIGFGLSILVFYLFDIQRFERIGYYLNRIFDSSSIASIFSPNGTDIFTSILIILIPLGIVVFLYNCYRNAKTVINYQNSIFWLTNIIFCYLLILPIYDSTLISRFVLYICLPLIFVLTYTLQYAITKQWIKKLVLGTIILSILTIASANISTLFFLNKNKKEVYRDLMEMKQSVEFQKNDLILTRHGAEHISNWFLGTKACLITSFSNNDLKKYDRLFILNPTKKNTSLASDTDVASKKYYYMTINIPEPEEASLIFESNHIRLLQLKKIPKEWKFDSNGNWKAYK